MEPVDLEIIAFAGIAAASTCRYYKACTSTETSRAGCEPGLMTGVSYTARRTINCGRYNSRAHDHVIWYTRAIFPTMDINSAEFFQATNWKKKSLQRCLINVKLSLPFAFTYYIFFFSWIAVFDTIPQCIRVEQIIGTILVINSKNFSIHLMEIFSGWTSYSARGRLLVYLHCVFVDFLLDFQLCCGCLDERRSDPRKSRQKRGESAEARLQ